MKTRQKVIPEAHKLAKLFFLLYLNQTLAVRANWRLKAIRKLKASQLIDQLIFIFSKNGISFINWLWIVVIKTARLLSIS